MDLNDSDSVFIFHLFKEELKKWKIIDIIYIWKDIFTSVYTIKAKIDDIEDFWQLHYIPVVK